jgi:hypothetical protein
VVQNAARNRGARRRMNRYLIIAYQIPGTDLIGKVLYKVEKTGNTFSWKDSPEVISREEIKVVEIVVDETQNNFTYSGKHVGAIKMVEPNSILEFPTNDSALLWMKLKYL